MERVLSLCVVTTMGWMLACGSAGYCGHGHAAHGSSHPASTHPKPPHPAPKHPPSKSPKSNGPKPEAKPKGHEGHKSGPPKPQAKSPVANPKERGSHAMVGGPKSNDKSHEHDHDHHSDHDHHHDHHHWHGDHVWVNGVEVDGGTVTDGSAGVIAPADGAVAPAMVVPDTAAPVPSLGRQIQFSVDPQERNAYDAAARAAGMSRAEWIRSRLNVAVQQEAK